MAGLKVVAPATPDDAKGLLLAAFEDGNPVLYLEHKLLYRSAKGAGARRLLHACPSARRAWRAKGRDATVVTYGVGVHWALEAAERARRRGARRSR